MRNLLLGVLCVVLLASALPAQPQDGDLIIANFRDPNTPGSYGPGSVFAVNPTSGAIFTIAASHTTIGSVKMGPNWVEMAADNKNLMVPSLPTGFNGIYFHEIDPVGNIVKTHLAITAPGSSYCNACDLEYDGTWLLAGSSWIIKYDPTTGTVTTIPNTASPSGTHNAFVIDQQNGADDWVVGKFNSSSSTTVNMMGADATGYKTTISTAGPAYVSGIRIDRATGDIISSGFGLLNGTGGEFSRTTKSGSVTTLNTAGSLYRANAIYIDKQQTAWLLSYDTTGGMPPSNPNTLVTRVVRMDLNGVLLTFHDYSTTLTRNNFAPSGITEYGSRHVVCKGTGASGSTVTIKISSRKSTDASKQYQLAASSFYTNGIQMANGEYLHLNVGDPLFLLTATNTLGAPIFNSFFGTLDTNGEAAASVQIPSFVPPNLDYTIFISGVVIDPLAPGGISTVFNTHWFVLN